MRVLPITLFNNIKINPTYHVKNENNRVTSPLLADTVSFGHAATNAEPLRELMKIGGIDIWTGKPVIPMDTFEQMLKSGLFNRTIKTILKAVEPLKAALHKVPLEIYEMLSDYAKLKPDAHLDEIIQQWTPLAQLSLLKKQQPIFKRLIKEAKALPQEKQDQFDKLMEITQNQIQKKPIRQEFDKRDFRYKLARIAQKIRQRNIPDEISAMNKLIKMSKYIPYTPNKKAFVKKNSNEQKDIVQNQKKTLKQLKNFFERSVICKDEELQALFSDVTCQVNGIPTFIPFGRHNFIEEIKHITCDIKDQVLAHKLVKIAAKLPTASQESSAFIVKASRKPSEKIGYDWLWGCVGDIEHIDLYSKGGKDGLSNYAISTHYTNSERSNRSFAQQLREHPESYFTIQLYIDSLIGFFKGGILKQYGLNAAYIRNLAHKFEDRSPKEKPLVIDLSKL